jgi:CubicO group peptidase (beta-lactamase class C family)
MRPVADRGPGEGDHSRADRCLAPLVSRGNIPALAYAVVRDGDAALGGFGGAGPRTIFEIGSPGAALRERLVTLPGIG